MSGALTLPPPAMVVGALEGRLRLRWTDRSGSRTVDLERTTLLGSSEHVDVVIADPTVSRVHAEIEVDASGAWVRDLGSRNGTFVDRVEVKGARIAAGQTLRLASSELRIEKVDLGASGGVELWPETRLGPLIGESDAMRELFATLARVAETDISVFVRGETGSGKELVARAIHESSPRKNGPYVVVDCAAIAESLLASELFGHAKGAFTGAVDTRQGALEAANGGTVFLDEIGELPLDMQPKLLRALEQRTVRRVGESSYRPIDVRFIAATHRDLVDFVAKGWFREDLYFRLAVLPIRVPPLRERMEDVVPLAKHFLGELAPSLLTPAFVNALLARPWQGNVRELRNVLDRARALGVDRAFSRDSDEPRSMAAAPALTEPPQVSVPPPLLDLVHRDFRDRWAEMGERIYLEQKLRKHEGNVSKVAREVELARTYTHKLLKKHGL